MEASRELYYANSVYGGNCTQANLSASDQSFFSSAEFQGLGYTNAQKVEALYRAILNRDPDQGGFNAQLNALNGGTPITAIAANMYGSSEFAALVSRICSNAPYYWGNASAGNTANSTAGDPTWIGRFSGSSDQVLFYSPGDQHWFLGTVTGGALSFTQVATTSGFGNTAGDPTWIP